MPAAISHESTFITSLRKVGPRTVIHVCWQFLKVITAFSLRLQSCTEGQERERCRTMPGTTKEKILTAGDLPVSAQREKAQNYNSSFETQLHRRIIPNPQSEFIISIAFYTSRARWSNSYQYHFQNNWILISLKTRLWNYSDLTALLPRHLNRETSQTEEGQKKSLLNSTAALHSL